jgi:uncharacterized protein (TIGR04255 family)
MAEARALRNPPIQEAVIQFGFAGVDLKAEELKQLAGLYEADGWEVEELHAFEATFHPKGKPEISAEGAFLGYLLTSPEGSDLVQLRAAQASGSTKKYNSWEALTAHARKVFERYVKLARPTAVMALSARFINRIPPYAGLEAFGEILTRPPVPLDDLPGAVISDFLRRHVVTGLDGGYTALLTIGTVEAELDEGSSGKALVIDIDVRKNCEIEPKFDVLAADLVMLRGIKNKLFFGSLKDEIVEKFL